MKVLHVTYNYLGHNCRLTVLREGSCRVMHYTAIVIADTESVCRRGACLFKVILSTCNNVYYKTQKRLWRFLKMHFLLYLSNNFDSLFHTFDWYFNGIFILSIKFLPDLTLFQLMLTYESRSDRFCSCRNPQACISSWMTVPILVMHPGVWKFTSCRPPIRPTLDQQPVLPFFSTM